MRNRAFVFAYVVLIVFASSPSSKAQVEVNITGRWQVTEVPNAPWVFEFAVDGTALTGTIQQSRGPGGAVSIAGGKIDGTTISFKILTPDAGRLITFRGRVNGNEISFVRQIDVLPGGSRGGNDLYGASAALQFVARRPR
jgi:hypothetical protein